MNLLFENAPDHIVVGGKIIKMKTDFRLWVKYITASENKNADRANEALGEIFGNIRIPARYTGEFFEKINEWLFDKCRESAGGGAPSFSFDEDGNVIFAELWNRYPHLMENNPSFHEFVELIRNLLCDESSELWHRAFARTGDFSKLPKEQREYWNRERRRLRLKDKRSREQKEYDFERAMSRMF